MLTMIGGRASVAQTQLLVVVQQALKAMIAAACLHHEIPQARQILHRGSSGTWMLEEARGQH
jgi:hypothetical protein